MSHNTLIHKVVRPAVRHIAPTGVTPNQLTTVRLLTAIGAAAGFAQPGTFWPAIGGISFVISMLFDRADGELARQTGKSSIFGYRYDLFSDCAADVAVFAGIGFGQYGHWGWMGPALGAFAGICIAIIFFQLNVLKLGQIKGFDMLDGRISFDADDMTILIPILVWLQLAPGMLIAAAILTPLAALYLALRPRRPPGT